MGYTAMTCCTSVKWEIAPKKTNNGNSFAGNMTLHHVGLAFRQTHVDFYQDQEKHGETKPVEIDSSAKQLSLP